MQQPREGADEGWPWRRVLLSVLVPFLAPKMARSNLTALDGMRIIFCAVVYALLMLLLVVAVAVPWQASETVPPLSWSLIGIGAVGGTGVVFMRRRELDCGDHEKLANGYRQRMLFGIALAEAPAILAFVAALVADQAWLYLVGLAVAAVALVMIAPTAGDLERKEAELRAEGCAQSLRQALAASAKRH